MRFSTIVLIAAIIMWGVILGGIAYSHIVYFPVLLSDLPASSAIVNGKYALHEEKFWMAIHPVLIALLLISIASNWNNRLRRKNILVSFILYAIVLIVSAIYFIPELINFNTSASTALPASEWMRRGNNWMTYSIIRGVFMFAAIIPLFMALLKPAVIKKELT